MDETNTEKRKPLVIICLDDPLAQQLAGALPEGVYEIRFAQSAERGNKRMNADAYEAMQLVESNGPRTGFVVSDEATASSLSGGSLTMSAGRKGWHTVLRSGSNKSNLAIMADRYISGEFDGDKNVQEMAKFIKERTDENGQLVPKSRLPETVLLETAFEEYEARAKASSDPSGKEIEASQKESIKGIITALGNEIASKQHEPIRQRLSTPNLSRATAYMIIDDIVGFIKQPDKKLKYIDATVLQRLLEESRPKTAGEELQKEFERDPQAFHERAISEVRKREIVGDEPPGSTEAFIERVKKEFPDFRLPEEQEMQSITFAKQELERQERRKGKSWARYEGD